MNSREQISNKIFAASSVFLSNSNVLFIFQKFYEIRHTTLQKVSLSRNFFSKFKVRKEHCGFLTSWPNLDFFTIWTVLGLS